jgi:hypothetical protein
MNICCGTLASASSVQMLKVIWLVASSVHCLPQCFSNCGSQRSTGGFRKEGFTKIVSDTEQMKNTPIHVITKVHEYTLCFENLKSHAANNPWDS